MSYFFTHIMFLKRLSPFVLYKSNAINSSYDRMHINPNDIGCYFFQPEKQQQNPSFVFAQYCILHALPDGCKLMETRKNL